MNFDKTAKLQNIAISRVEVKFLNLNESSLLTGGNKLNDYLNFITANGEFRNVSQYEVLQYKNIYEGIDMIWEVNKDIQKYSFHVQAGKKYQDIQLQINGAKNIFINELGELRFLSL
ncbi:MAG: hypothetical protein IPI22_14885 [Bacteroidetes bacterium]|nr:hypothetical protein [Bacteroidota bacterium]